MNSVLQKLGAGLAVLLAGCSLAHADQKAGSRVPNGTSTGQIVTWSSTANGGLGGWVISGNFLTNGSQVAIGGSIDTGSRLSVNPQGASEKGVSIRIPAGVLTTGLQVMQGSNTNFIVDQYGFITSGGSTPISPITNYGNGSNLALVKNGASSKTYLDNRGGGTAFWSVNVSASDVIDTAGASATRFYIADSETSFPGNDGFGVQSIYAGQAWASYKTWFLVKNGTGLVGINNTTPAAQLDVVAGSASTSGLSIKAASGQTADLLDISDSTSAVKAKVDKNFVMTAKGFASAVRVVTATDTATVSDSVLLCNGTFTETLPSTGYPTGYRMTIKDTGTGTVTLTAGGTVTFDGATTLTFSTQYKSRVLVFDGTNFQIESGYL